MSEKELRISIRKVEFSKDEKLTPNHLLVIGDSASLSPIDVLLEIDGFLNRAEVCAEAQEDGDSKYELVIERSGKGESVLRSKYSLFRYVVCNEKLLLSVVSFVLGCSREE